MQYTRLLTLFLVFTLTSALAGVSIAKEVKTNSERVNTSTIEKNTQKPPKEVTPQQKCIRFPYC